MQSPPRPRRKDLKHPTRDTENRGPRGAPARKRPLDAGGRPPNIRHSTKKGGPSSDGGKPSYGKNKKRKGR